MDPSRSPPPPMDEGALARQRSDVRPHDHAVFLFDDERELAPALAEFVRGGSRHGWATAFVHSFPTDERAWSFLREAIGDEAWPPRTEVVVVSLYKHAFQGDRPRIDYAHVGRVIGDLQRRATEGGKAGVRVFVDASRRYFAEARDEEWFSFEGWLGRRLEADVGLVCAYQRADVMTSGRVSRVLETHAYRFGPDAAA